MAPRTRSNRAEKLAVQKLLSSGISVNTGGFPALPNELYLEILSYLPAFPIPYDVEQMDPYRQLTLYYLSQTCQSLRKFFLRYAWERIEVFEGMWTPMGRLATKAERDKRGMDMKCLGDKKLVQEIFRQLGTVNVRNPDLRQYVSVVNLTIPEYSHHPAPSEIAQNLSLFPNLHSLQLMFRFLYRPKHHVFSEFRYLNVHTLCLNRMGPHQDLLLACPNTKDISCYKQVGFHLRDLLGKECAPGIEKLGAMRGLRYRVDDMIGGLPHLCDLSLDTRTLRISAEYLKRLSSLPLHTIRLRLDYRLRRNVAIATPDERQRWIRMAKGILAKCPQQQIPKKVIVDYDNTVNVYSV